MIILGIDPGLATTGWGVIKKNKSEFEMINFGCILTPTKLDHIDRLLDINKQLVGLIKKYKPVLVAVEELFFYKNVKTALKVAEARGVILSTIAQLNLSLEEFTPLQIKQALTGYGRADKQQIQQMVKAILKLKIIPKPDDAADALAVAITAAQTAKFKQS